MISFDEVSGLVKMDNENVYGSEKLTATEAVNLASALLRWATGTGRFGL